jgi:hypothetical protein
MKKIKMKMHSFLPNVSDTNQFQNSNSKNGYPQQSQGSASQETLRRLETSVDCEMLQNWRFSLKFLAYEHFLKKVKTIFKTT